MCGDYLIAINKMDSNLKLIKIGDVPPEEMTTSDQMYDEGRRVELAKERLEKASIYFQEDKDQGVGFYVMAKRNPYVPEPALDHMIYVAKEKGVIRSIDELSPSQLKNLFSISRQISNTYRNISEDHGGLAMSVTSINFHDNPIYDQSVFGKKVHAQSIKDIHMHVFGITNDTINSLENVEVANLSQMLKDYMFEPFDFVLQYIYQTSLVQDIIDRFSVIRRSSDQRFEGLVLEFDKENQDSQTFYEEFIEIHRAFNYLYSMISKIFVDTDNLDSTGMPKVLPQEDIELNIIDFVNSLRYYPQELPLLLNKIGRLIIAGETAQGTQARVFLRGPAYTLTIINQEEDNKSLVSLSPRVFSTGNALTSLRLLYRKIPLVNNSWLETREDRQNMIAEKLKEI